MNIEPAADDKVGGVLDDQWDRRPRRSDPADTAAALQRPPRRGAAVEAIGSYVLRRRWANAIIGFRGCDGCGWRSFIVPVDRPHAQVPARFGQDKMRFILRIDCPYHRSTI